MRRNSSRVVKTSHGTAGLLGAAGKWNGVRAPGGDSDLQQGTLAQECLVNSQPGLRCPDTAGLAGMTVFNAAG